MSTDVQLTFHFAVLLLALALSVPSAFLVFACHDAKASIETTIGATILIVVSGLGLAQGLVVETVVAVVLGIFVSRAVTARRFRLAMLALSIAAMAASIDRSLPPQEPGTLSLAAAGPGFSAAR